MEGYPGTDEVSAPYARLNQRLKTEVELGGEVWEEEALPLHLPNQRAQKYPPVEKICQQFSTSEDETKLTCSVLAILLGLGAFAAWLGLANISCRRSIFRACTVEKVGQTVSCLCRPFFVSNALEHGGTHGNISTVMKMSQKLSLKIKANFVNTISKR